MIEIKLLCFLSPRLTNCFLILEKVGTGGSNCLHFFVTLVLRKSYVFYSDVNPNLNSL